MADFRWKHLEALHFNQPRSKVKGDLPGTPKDMGPPYGNRDPYHSHIFRDSNMGVGLGNSTGKGSLFNATSPRILIHTLSGTMKLSGTYIYIYTYVCLLSSNSSKSASMTPTSS